MLTHAGPRCCCRGEGEREPAGNAASERAPAGSAAGTEEDGAEIHWRKRAPATAAGDDRDRDGRTTSSTQLSLSLSRFVRSAASSSRRGVQLQFLPSVLPSLPPLSAGQSRRRNRRRRRRRESFRSRRRCRLRRRLRINASGPSVRPSHGGIGGRQQHGSGAVHTLLGRSAGARDGRRYRPPGGGGGRRPNWLHAYVLGCLWMSCKLLHRPKMITSVYL